MDLEARKLTIIEQFIKIQNIDIISQFENILKKTKDSDYSKKTFSVEEYKSRIQKSIKNSKKGKLTDNNKLISEIEKWN